MAEIINSVDFESKVLKNDKLVLVDFFATWCMPCKMLSPIVEQVSKTLEYVDVYKIDIDESMDISKDYGVMSVPTLILFKNGEILEKFVGFRQLKQITEEIEKYK